MWNWSCLALCMLNSKTRRCHGILQNTFLLLISNAQMSISVASASGCASMCMMHSSTTSPRGKRRRPLEVEHLPFCLALVSRGIHAFTSCSLTSPKAICSYIMHRIRRALSAFLSEKSSSPETIAYVTEMKNFKMSSIFATTQERFVPEGGTSCKHFLALSSTTLFTVSRLPAAVVTSKILQSCNSTFKKKIPFPQSRSSLLPRVKSAACRLHSYSCLNMLIVVFFSFFFSSSFFFVLWWITALWCLPPPTGHGIS